MPHQFPPLSDYPASQLAVDLALRFSGEVINGDAMQMYEGLPIITNKISLDERKGVPHHLLGCVSLAEPPWTVSNFVERASTVVGKTLGARYGCRAGACAYAGTVGRSVISTQGASCRL